MAQIRRLAAHICFGLIASLAVAHADGVDSLGSLHNSGATDRPGMDGASVPHTCREMLARASIQTLNLLNDARAAYVLRAKLVSSLEERTQAFEAEVRADRASGSAADVVKRVFFGQSREANVRRVILRQALERQREALDEARQVILLRMENLFKEYPDTQQALVAEFVDIHRTSLEAIRNYILTAKDYRFGLGIAVSFEMLNAIPGSTEPYNSLSSMAFFLSFRPFSKEELPYMYADVTSQLEQQSARMDALNADGADLSPLLRKPPKHFAWSKALAWSLSLSLRATYGFDPLSIVNLLRLGTRNVQIRRVLKEAHMRESDIARWLKTFNGELQVYENELNNFLNANTNVVITPEQMAQMLE